MEALHRDYKEKVDFYYVYKAVAHSGINGFVEPFSLDERLKHIEIAKTRIQTEIPWICDSMENEVSAFFGGAPNAEFVIDPEGKVVRKRFWSDATVLRKDLEDLVGKSSTLTLPKDVETRFNVKTVPADVVASGVVPQIALPVGLGALKIEPEESEMPFYAKLRVEGTRGINVNGGQLHFMLSLDPLYKMHWNNLAGKVHIELTDAEGMRLSQEILESDDLEAKADIDPRQFLIDLTGASLSKKSSLRAKVSYHVCDDAQTTCLNVEQEYQIFLDFDRDGGTRPGVFMTGMFRDHPKWDKNGDGEITFEELPPRDAPLIMSHIDYSANGVIEKEEIERFLKMFNNGTNLGRADGAETEPSSEPETSSKE